MKEQTTLAASSATIEYIRGLEAEREELRDELVRRTTALDDATAELTRLREKYEGPGAELLESVQQQKIALTFGWPAPPFVPPRRDDQENAVMLTPSGMPLCPVPEGAMISIYSHVTFRMSATELLAEEDRLRQRMGKNSTAMLSAGGGSGAAHAYVKFDAGCSEVFFRTDWPSVIAAADAWIDARLASRDAGQRLADAIGIGG